MLEEDRYCVDISTQIMSVQGLLKKSNMDILDGHLRSCVTDAIMEGESQGEEKIAEIIYVLERYMK